MGGELHAEYKQIGSTGDVSPPPPPHFIRGVVAPVASDRHRDSCILVLIGGS